MNNYRSLSPLPTLTDTTPPATILVVDDEPLNQEIIAGFLGLEGYHVIAAEDGEAAFAQVASAPPDVILLDVLMPGMNGFEVCRQLKSDPATVFIPVVILTALRGAEERIKGVAAGADEFLSKPFDHVELVTRVKSLVRVKRLYDHLQDANQVLENRVTARTAELQHALQELRELDRLKSEFIANVSHELRTPLLHVKGYVDLLASEVLGQVNAEQAHGLKVTQGAIEQLERVVKDIVDFSDVYETRLSLEPMNIADVFEAIQHSFAAALARKAQTLTLHLPADLPLVRADAEALMRVMRHLVDNAIKFSPTQACIELLTEARPTTVWVAVRDTGAGVAPDKLEEIFKLFYTGDGSSTRKVGGLGLGLPLARKLLESHGAQLHVESTVGHGATFWFELPRVD